MNILLNTDPNILLQNDINKSKINFINKYGNYANNYNKLNALGEQEHVWVYFITILSLLSTIFLFFISKEEKDLNNKPIEKTSLKKNLRIVAWITLFIFIISLIYNGYSYIFSYLPQYKEWFKKLPIEAQSELKIIKSLNYLENITRNNNYNNYNNYNRYNPNSINIKF